MPTPQANRSASKGNPATHRMGNPVLKEKFARCWRNGRRRKDLRIKAAAEARLRNAALRRDGEPTPWETARAARRARRAI